MAHLGVLCPPLAGHLHPMSALGRELQRRGHRVTLFGVPDCAALATAEGLDYHCIGASDHPLGSTNAAIAHLGTLHGVEAMRYTLDMIRGTSTMILRDAPPALRAAGVDGLLVDQVEPAGATVADYVGLPFVTVCNALPVDRDPSVPPFFVPWTYRSGLPAELRTRLLNMFVSRLGRTVLRVLDAQRRTWSLPPLRGDNSLQSPLARISQLPRAFDFPRRNLSPLFHYTGPFRSSSGYSIPFPWDRLDGRPLIYASMGTLQNQTRSIFYCIAAACANLDAQLVLSLGGGGDAALLPKLPGRPLVVGYAPQPELLSRAALTITHAGLNTTLESLTHGVPMVAIPIANDQPGVAARIAWTGTGTFVLRRNLSAARLRRAVQQVLGDAGYRAQAARLQAAISEAGGAQRAADIVERALHLA